MDSREVILSSGLNSQNASVTLWDSISGNVLQQFKNGGEIAPKSLNLICKDYLIAANHDKPLVVLWPINSQEPVKKLGTVLPDKATCLSVSPCGSYVAAGIEQKVYVWHTHSGGLLSVQKRNYQPVKCVKFSNCGEFLAVGGHDGLLIAYLVTNLIDFSNGDQSQKELGQVDPLYIKSDHSAPICDLSLGSFGSKSRLASVSVDQSLRLYNLHSGEPLLFLIFNHPATSVLIDNSCWNLFVGLLSGDIVTVQLKNPPRTLSSHIDDDNVENTFKGHKDLVSCLDVNLSSTHLVSGSNDKNVYLWEIKSRQVLRTFEHKGIVTNVKFVLNFEEFFKRSFHPKCPVHSFSRDYVKSADFVETRKQDFDLEDCKSDDKTSVEDDRDSDGELKVERLQAANQELYEIALKLIQRGERAVDV